MKPYQVIALHPTTQCNLDCSFCYRPKKTAHNKSKQFFVDLMAELEPYTNQIAVGGGEILLDQPFLRDLGKAIQQQNMIMNVTTNGTVKLEEATEQYIEMISVSFDKEKRPNKTSFAAFGGMIRVLNELQDVRVGVNLLMEEYLFDPPSHFIDLVHFFFNTLPVERVFALSPKNWPIPDILKHKKVLTALSTVYEHFYVDDLTEKIITEESYTNWKKPCHYGTSMLSIDEQGNVKGCSFAEEPLFTLEKPEDIHNIKDMEIEKRYACPYLRKEE